MNGSKTCVVCHLPTSGSRVHSGECAEKWKSYMQPRPEHERLERDRAAGRWAQSDCPKDPDKRRTRSMPAR